jgi:ribonuclease HII
MIQPHTNFEKDVWDNGGLAAGIDEVGKGCIAGPVVAAAVVMPRDCEIHIKIRDSKTMTPKSRAEMFEYILDNCSDLGVGLVSAEEIDLGGINPATKKAMRLALSQLNNQPEMVLVDAVEIDEIEILQKAVIKGDAHIYSVAAASIVAKVFRDSIVSGLDNVYPEYGFSSHKGYGVKKHIDAISCYGMTPEHRKTFCTRIISTDSNHS